MSHTRVKTTYSAEGAYGSTETKTLYCHHNHSCDYTTFYDEDGSITSMCFGEWVTGDDLWDAMERLWFPFKDKWGGELKDKVEYYYKAPWEAENLNKPQEQQCNIHDVSNCPDLTSVWYKILEEHADDIPTRDKFCDALWMLEDGGFCQLKFAL